MSPLLARVLEVAASEVGVREEGGANRGRRVEEYLASVGLGPGNPWCAAFLVWCFREAAMEAGVHSPVPITGKVATLWRHAILQRRGHPFPGAVFVHLLDPDDPRSKGHCGLVTEVGGSHVATIEGNSNTTGSREGDSVVRNMRPLLTGYVTGWLDFSGEPSTEIV